MVTIGYSPKISVGDHRGLEVVNYNGEAVFQVQFIGYDSTLRTPEEDNWWERDYYNDPCPDLRSVRIFKSANPICLRIGEVWTGVVQNIHITDRKAKDGRTRIFLTMGELRRRYAWKREVEGNTLVMALWCGSLKLREKRIALKEHLYRIQEQSGRISEFRGLGTNKRPVAMIDWRMRSYRNIQELYQEETRGMRLKSFAPGIMKKLKEGIIQAGAKS